MRIEIHRYIKLIEMSRLYFLKSDSFISLANNTQMGCPPRTLYVIVIVIVFIIKGVANSVKKF